MFDKKRKKNASGPKKANKKDAFCRKMTILGGCPGFRKIFVLGVICRKIIGFIWRSKDYLEDEGPIWTHLEDQESFGDEGTFQESLKSWISMKPTIR